MRHRNNLHQWLRASLQPITALGLATIVVAWAGITWHLSIEEKSALQAAKQNTGNLARVFEEQIVRTVEEADNILRALRATHAKDPDKFDIETARVYLGDIILQVGVIGRDGILKATTRVPTPIARMDLSDEEHYRVHLNTDKDDLFIGKSVIGRVTGLPSIPLSRRLSNADGSFGGAIVVFIDQSNLTLFYKSIDVGQDGIIAVVGLDKVFRAARGFKNMKPDGYYGNLPLFDKVKESPTGFHVNRGTIDGIRRLVSYRKIEPLPLIVTVGLSEHEVFADYWRNRRARYIGTAFVTVVALTLIGFGVRRERKLVETTAEMRQAQEALQQSQERYTLVEAAVNDGIFDRDLQTDELYLSPRWKSILGYADDELPNVAPSFFDRIHPDDKATFAEVLRAHLEQNKPYTWEFRLRCKNGDYRWVQSRGKIFRDAKNRPVRLLGSTTDISERKQAQVAIEESHDNLARAETMALLGHYKYDYGSNTYTWSEGVYRIHGKSPASFTPTLRSVLELTHPDDRPIQEQYRRDLAAGLDLRPLNIRVVRDDGRIIDVEVWSKPIRASDGSVTGMFGTIQDVTAHRQAAAVLARTNQELEARVAERTDALAKEMHRREQAQMKLAQVQKMDAVGQLTAGIAHDFNNLLAVIGSGLEFVKRSAARGLTAEPELIDASIRATRRGAELVQRLLAFARQAPLKAESTTIDQLVLDTLRLLQRTLGEEIEIVTRLDAMAAMVWVDRNQLINALLNLALNARDAMPEGGQLTIATARQPTQWAAAEGSARWPTGEEVCITVSDTGAGMTEEVRNRVCEPFFTTKADGLGTGLGLSMAYGFVEQSGGHIEIDSVVGRGTTITIHLPSIAAAGQPGETNNAAYPATVGKEKTVLLVEDDSDVRIMMAAQVKQLGYKVHAVASVMEALDLILSPTEIDVTLTDIVLPGGVDGVTLLKDVMEARPGMGVLCMSGYDPSQKHRKWLEMQNIEFLEKPFSSAQLAQALDNSIAK